ncbi:VOC family protein [Tepidiforma sp.]|uniref:VOC family protein n=1 Tax=Tepidiforma sp. TaxID=2682230 RepID=UPI002ADDB00D|nr:VOC family protein [Tepidiforma sp.]
MPGWGAIPALRVVDLAASLGFYRDVLGFTVRQGSADDGHVSLTFGDGHLMLERPAPFYSPAYNAAIQRRMGQAGPTAVYFEADDLGALWRRVCEHGAPVIDELAARPWGQTEFTVEDPDGNWLTFWQSLGAAEKAGGA